MCPGVCDVYVRVGEALASAYMVGARGWCCVSVGIHLIFLRQNLSLNLKLTLVRLTH